ncbi:hypothetical protein GW17_00048520, partial [Ensete ventricosum]
PSNLALSTTKRMGEIKYLNSLTYPAEELYISSMRSVIVCAPCVSSNDGLAQDPSSRLSRRGAEALEVVTLPQPSDWPRIHGGDVGLIERAVLLISN